MSTSPTILLVIDDPAFRGGLMTALRARGMRPVLMGDGEQARSFLATETPALAIVDPRIPGGGGVAWIRARREEGLSFPMVMCATTREEAQALLLQTDSLGVASVIPKQAPADTLAAHIEELLAEPQAVESPVDTGKPVQEMVEKLRVSLVNLQKNAESRDRLNTSLEIAQALEKMSLSAETRSDVCAAAAKKIIEMFIDARDGRHRLDNSAWVVIEKLMVRAREAAGAVTGPPLEARRASASAHSSPLPAAPEPPRTVTVDIDELTGLFTREAFLREATEHEHGAMVDGRPLAFSVIGVDGADALRAARRLDAVLEELGRFLQSRFRPDDIRGRWLPDAFALAFPGTPGASAVATLTRTFEAFAQLGLADAKGQPLKLSAGVATYPKEGRDAALALQTAEQRMRAAQRRGGAVIG